MYVNMYVDLCKKTEANMRFVDNICVDICKILNALCYLEWTEIHSSEFLREWEGWVREDAFEDIIQTLISDFT